MGEDFRFGKREVTSSWGSDGNFRILGEEKGRGSGLLDQREEIDGDRKVGGWGLGFLSLRGVGTLSLEKGSGGPDAWLSKRCVSVLEMWKRYKHKRVFSVQPQAYFQGLKCGGVLIDFYDNTIAL